MSLKKFTYQNSEYNLFAIEGCIDLLNAAMPEINLVCRSIKPSEKKMHVSEFDKRVYSVVVNSPSSYYIHRLSIPESFDTPVGHKAIVKLAMTAMYLKSECILPKFIYTTDKAEYQSARGISKDDYDRLDVFRCQTETKDRGTDKEKSVVRHFGTFEGQLAYAKLPKSRSRRKLSREETRNENNHFIRVMMNGPDFSQRPITDPFNRSLIESVELFNDLEGKAYSVNTYTLHHCLYVNSTSVYKDGAEPSKALNTKSYTKFEPAMILEFMGMIALGEDGHKTIHKTHYHDDIQGWFRRYMRGEVFWIPFHWRNEANYRKTTAWLLKHVDDLSADDLPSYFDFVKSLSFTDEHKEAIRVTLGYIPDSTTVFALNVE